ncbi:Calcium-independent phospholipase a2-gamma [Coniochaeta hoffmannii]|uniref:Calcium-independent phospholipase a2-gamma n=1 Tax=Coniochaeta hoffmannii TaxID=91930 RepID=A0AA38VCN7_9PEZI|nr:Calcium-independent phospholipase a2-gamma [Coniochaeta hoffmannii]
MSSGNRKKLKILVLDGGGVKGLSSLLILENIMARVGKKMNRPDLQPCDYFDIIGGTSTGGIIALMLGRMRMPVEKCITEYQELGRLVFGVPRGGLHEYMFDARVLEEHTKKVVKKYLGDENAPLLDPLGDDACKTIVFTLPYKGATPESPESLRTYINDNVNPRPKPWAIWEAVRATSAATTIFEPFTHGPPGSQIRYIDAAFGFNNPADHVMEEAASLWTETGYLDTRSDVGCLLSIGTGMANVTRMESDTIVKAITSKVRKPLQAVEVMKKIATATEPIHRNVARRFDPSSGVYQRFNVDQGIQAVKLFDHEKREEIEVDTTAYMQKHSVHWQLSQAVDIMKNIGIRELMADRDESEQIYSTGDGGVDEELKLKQRLEALRIKPQDFLRHQKHWESTTSTRDRGSQYYQALAKEIGNINYMWNAFVQADLLDKRGRCILARRFPTADESQLCVSSDQAQIAYSAGREDLETTVRRLTLAHGQLREAFGIYRQLFHSAQQFFGEVSVTYCWAAKRLASLLELWGCQGNARDLYMAAWVGKSDKFDASHWSVQWLEKKIADLNQALNAQRLILP